MKESVRYDRMFATASWVIVGALLYAALAIWFTPVTGGGPVSSLVGVTATKFVYCIVYGGLASLLAYAKLFKKKKMRKHVLVAVYFVGTFTFLMGWLLAGIALPLLDNLIMGFAAGACWLYWKFKTEYIDPNQFFNEISELREDLPPSA